MALVAPLLAVQTGVWVARPGPESGPRSNGGIAFSIACAGTLQRDYLHATWHVAQRGRVRVIERTLPAHPANRVVSEVHRPGGCLFTCDGKLIRSAQDRAAHYASAPVFNEVPALSPTHYKKRSLSRLSPGPSGKPVACRASSASETLEVLDARGFHAPGMTRLRVIDLPAAQRVGDDVSCGSAAVAACASLQWGPAAPACRAPRRTSGRESPLQ